MAPIRLSAPNDSAIPTCESAKDQSIHSESGARLAPRLRRGKRPELAARLTMISTTRSTPTVSNIGGFPDGAEIPGTAENIQAVVGEPTPHPPATRTRPSASIVAVWRYGSI